jgi:hypothetical protein
VLFSSSLSPDEACLDGPTSESTYTSSKEALIKDIESLADERTQPLLKDALADTHSHLTLEEKARTLQMIMQCSSDALAYMESLLPPAKEVKDVVTKTPQDEPMLALIRELDRNKTEFQLPVIQQRMLYVQIAKTFEHETAGEDGGRSSAPESGSGPRNTHSPVQSIWKDSSKQSDRTGS